MRIATSRPGSDSYLVQGSTVVIAVFVQEVAPKHDSGTNEHNWLHLFDQAV